mmetsp:Transcript_16780/g.53665  ORF Transcript_16780/g.53665 Transcript_16780/m.53665 type:complete len:210 (+) Transcript_16780:919-1548(+)
MCLGPARRCGKRRDPLPLKLAPSPRVICRAGGAVSRTKRQLARTSPITSIATHSTSRWSRPWRTVWSRLPSSPDSHCRNRSWCISGRQMPTSSLQPLAHSFTPSVSSRCRVSPTISTRWPQAALNSPACSTGERTLLTPTPTWPTRACCCPTSSLGSGVGSALPTMRRWRRLIRGLRPTPMRLKQCCADSAMPRMTCFTVTMRARPRDM